MAQVASKKNTLVLWSCLGFRAALLAGSASWDAAVPLQMDAQKELGAGLHMGSDVEAETLPGGQIVLVRRHSPRTNASSELQGNVHAEDFASEDTIDSEVAHLDTGCTRLTHDVVDPDSGGWQNGWDKGHKVECKANHAIVSVYSKHDNGKEDRVWKVHCRAIKGPGVSLSGCTWTGYTGYDKHWKEPPASTNQIITGIESHHDNGKEDRKFRFKYCSVKGVQTGQKHEDGNWRNGWDGTMKVQLPSHEFFRTWESKHDNGKEDRVFKFQRLSFCLNKINCKWHVWTHWSPCPKTCGSAEHHRTRAQTKAQHGGAACSGSSKEKRKCNTRPCPTTTTTTTATTTTTSTAAVKSASIRQQLTSSGVFVVGLAATTYLVL